MSSLLHKLSGLRTRHSAAAEVRPSLQQDPVYRPLDASHDSTRLVLIHPAHADDDPEAPIRCTVSEAKFSDRPQYEALSYMWGDDTVQRPIVINDQPLQVTQNLFHAVHFLRTRQRSLDGSVIPGSPGARYWIDAICINQNDVHEKNKQIRIMPHIYFRAKTVLVWLGRKEVDTDQEAPQSSEKFHLYKTIYHDEYWTRLWIIQEIGKATQLQVCYVMGSKITALSSYSLEWNQLIQDIEAHYTRLVSSGDGQDMNGGPLRLDRQLRGKYTGSHSLLSLIETHRDARCKNPRDKIFGLVGLSTDSTRDFPIDYQKSLFEVWKDTLKFLHLAGNLVDVALLVLESLGGPTQVLPTQTPSAKISSSPLSALNYYHAPFLGLRLAVLGIVMFVGPPPEDLINSLEQADLWTKGIQRGVKHGHLGSLLRENDGLFEWLLRMGDDLDLPSLGIGPSRAARDPQRTYQSRPAAGFSIQSLYGPHLTTGPTHLYTKPAKQQASSSSSSKMKFKSNEKEQQRQPCRLYRLKMVTSGPSADEEGCNLGLATDVQPKDLLCRIPQTGKTFFLRSPKSGSGLQHQALQIAGTALVAQELFPPDKRVQLRAAWDLTLNIDPETLYRLLT